MSNTPKCRDIPHYAKDFHTSMLVVSVSMDYALQLKRELNASNEHIKRMELVGDELLEWLKDSICESNLQLLSNAWKQAKENKL